MINNFKDEIINGAIAGCISVCAYQPFQVVRTSMMVTYEKGKNASMIYIIKRIINEEGVKGFFRGFTPALIKTAYGTGAYFGALEFAKKAIGGDAKNHKTNFLASGFARLIQSILINPVVVIKTRFEVVGFNSYNSISEAVYRIRTEEGYKGFFKGLKPTLVKDVPASALFYSLYQFAKHEIAEFTKVVQYQAIGGSLFATIICAVLTNPLDVLRTRVLYYHFSQNKNHDYKGIISGLSQIFRQEGVRGLLSGIMPKFVKKSVAGITVWTSYETLKDGIK